MLGLIVGPFVGIVVDRAVERERPRLEHRCPKCGAHDGVMSLVPVANWFRRCPEGHLTWRYQLVDLATAGSFVAAGLAFGWSPELWPHLLVFAALVAMSVIDLETHLLVDILTLRTLAVAAFLVVLVSGFAGMEDRVVPAFVGAATYWLILFVVYRIYPPGLGFGDVKLAPTLGLLLGWLTDEPIVAVRLVLYAMLLSFLALGVLGTIVNLARGRRKAELPLGPFLALSTIALIFAASSPDSVLTAL